MLRSTLVLAVFFLTFNVSFAQSPSDLKGPAAKNYKPWTKKARTGTLVVRVVEKEVKGPFYKNKKPWKDEIKKSVLANDLRIREKITGPKAKNSKPWQSD